MQKKQSIIYQKHRSDIISERTTNKIEESQNEVPELITISDDEESDEIIDTISDDNENTKPVSTTKSILFPKKNHQKTSENLNVKPKGG